MNSLTMNEQRIIWIDCEMTGLDVNKDKLVELACIITEHDLKVIFLAKGTELDFYTFNNILKKSV